MKKRILSLVFAVLITVSTMPFISAFAESKYVKRSVSELGVGFIEAFEGYFQYAYWDYEHYTIGYGTTCTKNEYPGGISEEQAHELLKKVLPSYESGLNSFLSKNNIYVTQNQYDALLSFTYNFGAYVWDRNPTIAQYLKNGISKYTDKQIADAFGLWVKAGGKVLPGLVERRAAEAKYFCTGDFAPNKETYVLSDNTNVRTGAGTGYSSVGSIKKGTIISVKAKRIIGSYIWGQISYGGNDRWLSISTAKYGAIKNTSSTLYKPCLYSVANDSSGIKLTWTRVHNATGYKIYRKLSDSADYSLYKTITNNDTVTFTDKSVSNNKYYVYCIESYNASKTSNKSGYSSIYFIKAPLVKTTSRLSNGIKFTWYGMSGISGYYVMRKPSTDSHYTKIATVSSSTTSYSDTKAVGGVTYYYTVKCYTSKGVSGYENGLSNMYLSASKVSSSYNTANTMKVYWQSSLNATGYYLYRKIAGGSYSKIATVKGTSYTDKNVQSGKTYYYYVKAYKGSLISVAGTAYSAKMLPIIKPTSLNNTATGFKVSWSKNVSAQKYALYRAIKGGSYSKIATTTATSFTDTTATSGKTYYYKLSVINGNSSSAQGASKNGVYYAATKITTANSVSNGLKISFTKISNATEYAVYKTTSDKDILQGTVTTNSYIDKSATKAGSYVYKIVVKYGSKSSAKSTSFTAKKLATPVVKATASKGKNQLSWNKIASAKSYILYRKAPGETKFTKYKTLSATSFTDEAIKKGKAYSYRVKAKANASYSIVSATQTVTSK